MRGVNKAIIVGTLGNDPELKFSQGGMAVCTLSIATNEVRKDKDGNKTERVDWHRCKAFGKTGEIIAEYAKKGSQLYIEGSIRYDKFTGQDGVEKYFTDIIVDQFQFLGGKPEGSERTPRPQRQEPAPQRQAPPADDFDDSDIPF